MGHLAQELVRVDSRTTFITQISLLYIHVYLLLLLKWHWVILNWQQVDYTIYTCTCSTTCICRCVDQTGDVFNWVNLNYSICIHREKTLHSIELGQDVWYKEGGKYHFSSLMNLASIHTTSQSLKHTHPCTHTCTHCYWSRKQVHTVNVHAIPNDNIFTWG